MADHWISRCEQIVAPKQIKPTATARATANATPTTTAMDPPPAYDPTMHSRLDRQDSIFTQIICAHKNTIKLSKSSQKKVS